MTPSYMHMYVYQYVNIAKYINLINITVFCSYADEYSNEINLDWYFCKKKKSEARII